MVQRRDAPPPSAQPADTPPRPLRMLDNRSLKLDVFALALLGLVALLALAVLTYRPADPPSDLVYPPAEQYANACGRLRQEAP